jgi:hypothetical protein
LRFKKKCFGDFSLEEETHLSEQFLSFLLAFGCLLCSLHRSPAGSDSVLFDTNPFQKHEELSQKAFLVKRKSQYQKRKFQARPTYKKETDPKRQQEKDEAKEAESRNQKRFKNRSQGKEKERERKKEKEREMARLKVSNRGRERVREVSK